MNVIVSISWLVVIWYFFQRTKYKWIALIVASLLSLIYAYTEPGMGDWSCVGVLGIILGVIFQLVQSGVEKAEERN
jgi:hypothetical protein